MVTRSCEKESGQWLLLGMRFLCGEMKMFWKWEDGGTTLWICLKPLSCIQEGHNFLYMSHVSIFKKSMWIHREGDTRNFTANIKNIANPDIIDFWSRFLPVLLIWYQLLAWIFEADGKKINSHISEAALFKNKMNREFACPKLRIHEEKMKPR